MLFVIIYQKCGFFSMNSLEISKYLRDYTDNAIDDPYFF